MTQNLDDTKVSTVIKIKIMNNKKSLLLIMGIVFLFNLNIPFQDLLFHEDNGFYYRAIQLDTIFDWYQQLWWRWHTGLILTPLRDFFYSEGMVISLPGIRFIHLLLLCISSALTFMVLTNIVKLKKIYAIPASITPNIMPAYFAIPVGLNATYAVWSYIPIITAFLFMDSRSGEYQMFNSKRKIIFLVSYLFLIFISYDISIGAVLTTPVVILFPYLYRKKLGKSATFFLIFSSAFYSILHIVASTISVHSSTHREASILNDEVLYWAVKFINTVLPLQGWALLDRNTAAIAIILIIITGFALLAYSKRIYNQEVTLFHRVIVVMFLGLFVLGNTIPYIIQDPAYQRPEWHPYLANFGYQVLLFVFFGTLIEYAFIKKTSSKLLVYSFSIIVLFYGTTRLSYTQKYFAPQRVQSAAIRDQLHEKEIPPEAQLVILYTGNVWGAGILSDNSGYISYLLGRNDLSAIMGPEYTDHNIFKKVSPYKENMTNIEKNRPVLIFKYDPTKQTLHSKDYLLTFNENDNKIYTLYSLHNTGMLRSLFSGTKKALEDYLQSKSIPQHSVAFY